MAILRRAVGIAVAAALAFAAPARAETVVKVGLINSSTGFIATGRRSGAESDRSLPEAARKGSASRG
jgi:hypothetical protein